MEDYYLEEPQEEEKKPETSQERMFLAADYIDEVNFFDVN